MSLRHDFLRISCIVAVFFIPLNSQGIEVEGLYSASIVVVSRDDERERNRAFSSAMREVLLKVSGTSEVLQSTAVRQAVNNAEAYVESRVLRSISVNEDENDPDAGVSTTAQEELIELEISFYESEIQTLLNDNNLPLWSANRPETLVWLVVQEELGEREVLNSSSDLTRELMTLIQNEANGKGLPVLFPLMDLEDQQALSPDELWSMDEGAITSASVRYQTESILVMRIYQSLSDESLGESLYLFRNRSLSLDSFDEKAEEFTTKAIGMAAEELSAYYAILLSSGNGDTKVNLTIEGIDTAKDYAGLLNYVATLADVNSYQIVSVNQTKLLLELSTGGQLRQLVETIALEENLESTAELSRDVDGVYMSYRWMQ